MSIQKRRLSPDCGARQQIRIFKILTHSSGLNLLPALNPGEIHHLWTGRREEKTRDDQHLAFLFRRVKNTKTIRLNFKLVDHGIEFFSQFGKLGGARVDLGTGIGHFISGLGHIGDVGGNGVGCIGPFGDGGIDFAHPF